MGKQVMWCFGVFLCMCGLVYAADYNLGRNNLTKYFNLIGETEDFVSLESSPMIEGNEMVETPSVLMETPSNSSWSDSFNEGSCSSSSMGSCSSGGGSSQSRRIGFGFRPLRKMFGFFKGGCR